MWSISVPLYTVEYWIQSTSMIIFDDPKIIYFWKYFRNLIVFNTYGLTSVKNLRNSLSNFYCFMITKVSNILTVYTSVDDGQLHFRVNHKMWKTNLFCNMCFHRIRNVIYGEEYWEKQICRMRCTKLYISIRHFKFTLRTEIFKSIIICLNESNAYVKVSCKIL